MTISWSYTFSKVILSSISWKICSKFIFLLSLYLFGITIESFILVSCFKPLSMPKYYWFQTCELDPAAMLEITQHVYLRTTCLLWNKIYYSLSNPPQSKIESVWRIVPVVKFPNILIHGTTKLKYGSLRNYNILETRLD